VESTAVPDVECHPSTRGPVVVECDGGCPSERRGDVDVVGDVVRDGLVGGVDDERAVGETDDGTAERERRDEVDPEVVEVGAEVPPVAVAGTVGRLDEHVVPAFAGE
jgi:hypothetical protein